MATDISKFNIIEPFSVESSKGKSIYEIENEVNDFDN